MENKKEEIKIEVEKFFVPSIGKYLTKEEIKNLETNKK
jgi:hypothetical protein